jgi:hypothetical protein
MDDATHVIWPSGPRFSRPWWHPSRMLIIDTLAAGAPAGPDLANLEATT